MMDENTDPQAFQEGWERDYFSEYSKDDIETIVNQTWAVNLLVADYEQASEDARNRDTLLHNSYYVGLVLFGLIVNVAFSSISANNYMFLFIISSSGSFLYFMLFIWSSSSRSGRDASWDRRSEIEDMIKLIDVDLIRSNDSCFKRLSREDDGKYILRTKRWHEEYSIGRLIVATNAVLGVVLAIVAIWSAYVVISS